MDSRIYVRYLNGPLLWSGIVVGLAVVAPSGTRNDRFHVGSHPFWRLGHRYNRGLHHDAGEDRRE